MIFHDNKSKNQAIKIVDDYIENIQLQNGKRDNHMVIIKLKKLLVDIFLDKYNLKEHMLDVNSKNDHIT